MKLRQRKCPCGTWFQPRSSFQRACSPRCALEVAHRDAAQRARKETRVARERLKTRAQWLREAQAAFNAFIRERDRDLPCISCGVMHAPGSRGGDWDCGHYRSTGANPELRFCEVNAHKQCKRCNQHLSGNVANYRIGLLARIGPEMLAWLEGPHEPAKYSIEILHMFRDGYRARRRELERRRKEAA